MFSLYPKFGEQTRLIATYIFIKNKNVYQNTSTFCQNYFEGLFKCLFKYLNKWK